MIEDIVAACAEGARLVPACEVVGISVRTYRRWTRGAQVKADGRPTAVRPPAGHRLSEVERAEVLRVCNEPRFASLPPSQIVPRLADEGVYLASESWTPLIGQSLDDDKCFLQDERGALERSNETEKTKPLA